MNFCKTKIAKSYLQGIRLFRLCHPNRPDSCCLGAAAHSGREKISLEMGQWLLYNIVRHYVPVWWNWQTRRTQNPVVAIPCGFDPHYRHHVRMDCAPFKKPGQRPGFSHTASSFLLFRKRSRLLRLLGCKRPRDASAALPTFCGLLGTPFPI